MNQRSLLIIHREMEVRNSLSSLLATTGCRILTAETEAEAAGYVRENEVPDLLIVDSGAHLPKRSGSDLPESLREIPAVCFSTQKATSMSPRGEATYHLCGVSAVAKLVNLVHCLAAKDRPHV